MWLKNAFIICIIVGALAKEEVSVKTLPEEVARIRNDEPSRIRAVPIKEFVTSHKVPEDIVRSYEDEDYVEDDKRSLSKDGKHSKKVIPVFENYEKKGQSLETVRRFDSSEEEEVYKGSSRRPAHVELENFGDTGVLQEDGVRKSEAQRLRADNQKDSVIPGVYVSAEYPTTMMPVLTTPREARSFDFVPVNIIREDGKDSFMSFTDRHFGDLSDVSLVPAGTNSRIQVKKGPNGKDYEYEYVYYYYDEDDESKAGTAGSSVTNAYEIPSRTTASSRRNGSVNSNRSKYSTVERSSTVEPASNEVLPNRNSNRGRQLAENEDVSEERLPTNTRFPPRSRSNHNSGTTEPSRGRGSRPRPSLDLVDSSSFRTHQEGPEFPQVLPKGPVRFLGVTPNEDNEEKPPSRVRGRPQRIHDTIPVEEQSEEAPAPASRRRLGTTATPEAELDHRSELSRGQPSRSTDEDDGSEASSTEGLKEKLSEDKESTDESSSTASVTTDSPTTEYPSAMDKVALDLYAFSQQGQNNLIDASSSEKNDADVTTVSDDDATTDAVTTTELSGTTTPELITTTTTTTTTTTEATTTTTTTTEPSTTTTQAAIGRGKFRRPGASLPSGTRNRYKSNGGSTTSTEAPEPTQRTRSRFGSNGSNGSGFKRPRPGHKPVEEDTVQKESVGSVTAEKPSTRSRYRGNSGSRPSISTTTSAPSNSEHSGSSGVSRPSFNKLNLNRRRGRPTTAAPATSEEGQESVQTGQTDAGHETATASSKTNVRARLPGPVVRPGVLRPGARLNPRQKPGQSSTTAAPTPEPADAPVEEPAGEGTEEETHEAPAEASAPPTRSTTANPLTKLRNRNRLQVHPKTTTRSPIAVTPRRNPLLPRRKVTEAPVVQTSQEDNSSSEEETNAETEATEPTNSAETSTAASTKHEESRGLSSLLAPRRRIAPRRPGQIISRE